MKELVSLGLLLLSRSSHVQLCATPQTAAHQAPPSLRFSKQEHWSGLPVPSSSLGLARVIRFTQYLVAMEYCIIQHEVMGEEYESPGQVTQHRLQGFRT